MSDEKTTTKRVGMYDIVNIHPRANIINTERGAEDTVHKDLQDIVKIKKTTAEIKALESLEGNNQGSPLTPFQEVAELMNTMGMNPGSMAAARESEVKALREATTAAEREIHELRIREISAAQKRVDDAVSNAVQKINEINEKEKAKTGLLSTGQPANFMEKMMYDSMMARMNPPAPKSFLEQMQEFEAMDKFFRSRYAPPPPSMDPYASYFNNNVEMYKAQATHAIELEKMKIQRESSDQKTKALTDLGKQLFDILPDVAAAYGEAMKGEKAKDKSKDNGSTEVKSQAPRISSQNKTPQSKAPQGPGDLKYIKGECPHCHDQIPVPEKVPAEGLTGQCPYCKGLISFTNEQEAPANHDAEKKIPEASKTEDKSVNTFTAEDPKER